MALESGRTIKVGNLQQNNNKKDTKYKSKEFTTTKKGQTYRLMLIFRKSLPNAFEGIRHWIVSFTLHVIQCLHTV